ncbi:hypothetical protein EDB85DRAFT_1888287 [Lactarius pseudohatsudake]|nr:hypothetical protein EDB85DRAFT_1888287 [Lactarius pseudohatsudake]
MYNSAEDFTEIIEQEGHIASSNAQSNHFSPQTILPPSQPPQPLPQRVLYLQLQASSASPRNPDRAHGCQDFSIDHHSKLVREELSSLLNGKPPYGNAPSSSQLSTFIAEWESTGHGAKACEATCINFMIHLAGNPKSLWNKTACNDTPEMQKSIEKAFTTRVKSLKCQLKRDALPQAEKAVERSKHSQKQHKYKLFQHHREIAKYYSPLTKHLGLLDTLGVNGMSSDESAVDADTTRVTYTIIKPSWRHSLLHNWLKVFDQLHHQNHINSWSTDKHGTFAHIHTGSHKVHETVHAPPHLPINAYDPKWLESRETLYLRHMLCLVIGPGNPRVEKGYPYPYPGKPVPVLQGTGSRGYGFPRVRVGGLGG